MTLNRELVGRRKRLPLEFGYLRHRLAPSDFAGFFLPDALPYLWRRLNYAAALESGTFGRDRFVLRARAHRQRTESVAPDHRRFSSTQSGRVGLYDLRALRMAAPDPTAQKPCLRAV